MTVGGDVLLNRRKKRGEISMKCFVEMKIYLCLKPRRYCIKVRGESIPIHIWTGT
jgi:hypothetical protein